MFISDFILKNIPVEVSARHAHLDRNSVELLFGKNYKLNIRRYLSQPDQFLSEEKVTIKCNNNFLKNVSILGPERSKTQVEISLTDARSLKVEVPIRESNCLDDSAPCELIGPKGTISLSRGLIVPKRHIHVNLEHENLFSKKGLKDGSLCSLKIENKDRELIFNNTIIRIAKGYFLSAHLDTDEGNAAGIFGKTNGEIIF